MRFLVLTQYFTPEIGATQVRLEAFCKELVRAGHSVEVLTAMPHHPANEIFPHYRGRLYCHELLGGIKIHRVWLFAGGRSGSARIVGYLSFMILSFFGFFKVKKPDFVFVDSPPLFLGIPGWIASFIWSCPFIFNVADLWPDSVRDLGIMKDGPFLRAADILERWIYRRADYITAVTDGIRNVLENKKHVPHSKLLFLPNGVDTQVIRPVSSDESLRKHLGWSDKRIIIYAGNHGYAAAAEQIIAAARLLSEQPEFHFVFVGDGPEKAKLVKLAEASPGQNISFLDSMPLERLPALLALADVAVITLRRCSVTKGARPAKAFVMMAAGKPIVLAAEGEAAHLIQAANCGVVVPPYEPSKLAAALLNLLSRPQLAKDLGEKGRQYACEHFEWSVLVRSWLEQLETKMNLSF